MSTLHGPMTSTATTISQTTTPSLHLLREAIDSGGKGAANLDLNKVVDNKTNTNFQTDNSLPTQVSVSDVEDLKIQRQSDFAGSATGNFQYPGSSQNTDGSQALNLASEQNNQLRVMTVHSNDPTGQGSVSGLSTTSFAMSSTGGTSQVVTQVQNVLSSTEVVNVDSSGQVPASVTVENNAEGTKYTYYPAVQTADTSNGAGIFCNVVINDYHRP